MTADERHRRLTTIIDEFNNAVRALRVNGADIRAETARRDLVAYVDATTAYIDAAATAIITANTAVLALFKDEAPS